MKAKGKCSRKQVSAEACSRTANRRGLARHKGKQKEPRIHGMTINQYLRLMDKAHRATKKSTLVFK